MRKSKHGLTHFYFIKGVSILSQSSNARQSLAITILSLSLLTVMAGAAVAPALSSIQDYFYTTNRFLIQMVIGVPPLFIIIVNCLFPRFCQRFNNRTLVITGLLLYVVGGCAAGLFNNIYLVLLTRALVGIGVGIIMPFSTGLLAYYFPANQQVRLLGYSSAMNQMGGVIATLLAGLLANISWRASFLVYMMGLISIILCLIYLPNDQIKQPKNDKMLSTGKLWQAYHIHIIAIFLLMSSFFVYPANFSFVIISDGVIGAKYIVYIMALMDFIAFLGGLLSGQARAVLQRQARFLSPICFLLGYILLTASSSWLGVLSGSFLIGFANGAGIPYIISEASMKAGKTAATTIMPLLSAAMYLAQFVSPMLMSIVQKVFGGLAGVHLPYIFGIVLSLLFICCSALLPKQEN